MWKVGVFGIRSLGDVSGRDDVRGVFWFVFPATWSSETFDCDGCFDFYKPNGGQNGNKCRSKENETWFKKCVDLLRDQNRLRRLRIEPEKISRKHQKFNQTPYLSSGLLWFDSWRALLKEFDFLVARLSRFFRVIFVLPSSLPSSAETQAKGASNIWFDKREKKMMMVMNKNQKQQYF